MLRPIVVSQQPPLVIHNFGPEVAPEDSIYSLEIMDGRIAVDLHRAAIGKKAAVCAVLASVGMSNDEIAETTGRSPLTIKSHLQRMFDNTGINGRANIADWMFENGVYEVERQATAPHYSVRESQIVNLIVQGFQNKEIGSRLLITENTVKTHMQRITGKLGFSDREAIALASFVFDKTEVEVPAA